VKAVMDQLRPQAEQAIGRPLAIEFGTTASLLERIKEGVPFDAAVLTSEAIRGLMDDGKLTGDASGRRQA
jgi:ABC-type molybdate transport system substrate-binding protein